MASLNQDILGRIPLPLMAVSSQEKIAAVLSAYDDLIDRSHRRIKILEAMARRIYHEWFVAFRYPGHDEVHLVDSEVGPIPVDWSVHPLGDWVVQSARSIQPFRARSAVFEHFSIPAFDDRRLPAVEVGQAIQSNKFLVDRPSILYSKLNPRIPRVWWANPTIGLQSVASTELMVLQSTDVADRALLYATLTSSAFLARVVGLAGGTSTSHQRVRPASVMAIPTVVPSQPVRNAFSAVATPLYQLASSLTRTSERARALRDLLLPRLVSGEIDVTDLDIALPPTAAS